MIEERYLTATQSSNLRDDPERIGQVDVIKASGMSARNIASTYLRLISKPTQEDMTRFYAALLFQVEQRKLQGGTDSIVMAIDWLLNQNCKPCQGTGMLKKAKGEYKCHRCKGEGKRREPSCPDAQALIDYVQTCRAAYGGRMLKLLQR